MKFRMALAQYPIRYFDSQEEWKQGVLDFTKAAASSQLLAFPEYGSLDLTSLLTDEERKLENQVKALQRYFDFFLRTFEGLAKSFNVYISTPSFPIIEDSKAINRVFLFGPKGILGHQDKQKMTRFENEDWKIQNGNPALTVFQTDLGPIGINICYDVEFPRFASVMAKKGAKLLLAPSCTETLHGLNRVHVGARARALENQFFVGVSQTVGEAKWSPAVDFNTGQALVAGPPDLGFPSDGIINRGEMNKPGWVETLIDLEKVEIVRTQGSVLNFRDFQD